MTFSKEYQKGTELARELFGDELGEFKDIPALGPDDELPREAATFLYGYLMSERPHLDLKFRLMSAIGMLTCLQRKEMLASWIRAALRSGISKEEVREVIISMSIYAGWPVTRDGLKVARGVFEEKS
jgi:4-carboxymuconolactone decarboxylase